MQVKVNRDKVILPFWEQDPSKLTTLVEAEAEKLYGVQIKTEIIQERTTGKFVKICCMLTVDPANGGSAV